MTADIYEKAQTLAASIAESKELSDLRSSEKAMFEDSDAQQLIGEYQDAQQRLAEQQEKGEVTDELNSTIAALEEKLENNKIISAYLLAQDRFTEMLDGINSILAAGIASNPESVGEVGSSCSTCGGGCSTDGCF